jgi:hypothetical protein
VQQRPVRCLSLWKSKHHPDRPCDELDFDFLLDHFDEEDIRLAIQRFRDFGDWSKVINDSGNFRDRFFEIMGDVKPDESQDSDDNEGF